MSKIDMSRTPLSQELMWGQAIRGGGATMPLEVLEEREAKRLSSSDCSTLVLLQMRYGHHFSDSCGGAAIGGGGATMPLEALEEREANRLGNADRSALLGGAQKGHEAAEPVDVEAGEGAIGSAVGNSRKQQKPGDHVSLCNVIACSDCAH